MEMDLPPILCDYMCRRMLAEHQPAYLHLDHRGRVLSGGGHLKAHRLEPLTLGEPVSTICDFMEGMLPLEDDACHLGCLQPQADACIDAHIIPDGSNYWLLLLDMRKEERKVQAMQQQANELALLREAQADQGDWPVDAAPGLAQGGARLVVAALAGGIRLASDEASKGSPVGLLDRLGLFRRRLEALLRAEAGLICARRSDLLMALFGLRRAKSEAVRQSLDAALRILQDAACHFRDPQEPQREAVYAALGVATGSAVVGFETGPGAAGLQAVGEPIQLAFRLQQQAAAGQVLIDQTTFDAAGARQIKFQPLPAGKGDRQDPIYAYQRKSHP
jgi:class 3 adenylate cyclase